MIIFAHYGNICIILLTTAFYPRTKTTVLRIQWKLKTSARNTLQVYRMSHLLVRRPSSSSSSYTFYLLRKFIAHFDDLFIICILCTHALRVQLNNNIFLGAHASFARALFIRVRMSIKLYISKFSTPIFKFISFRIHCDTSQHIILFSAQSNLRW